MNETQLRVLIVVYHLSGGKAGVPVTTEAVQKYYRERGVGQMSAEQLSDWMGEVLEEVEGQCSTN